MKLFVSLLIFVALLVSVPFFADAVVSRPVGGKIVAQQPCNTGMLLYVKGATGITPYMWFWGNLPYLSYVPPHIGQNILGNSRLAPIPCVLGVVPYGAGLPIMFHGSSI